MVKIACDFSAHIWKIKMVWKGSLNIEKFHSWYQIYYKQFFLVFHVYSGLTVVFLIIQIIVYCINYFIYDVFFIFKKFQF